MSTFGNLNQGRHVGGNLDNSHYANEGAKRGAYDTSGEYEKDLGNRQNHRRNNYYDSREEGEGEMLLTIMVKQEDIKRRGI
ncbi:hypothetical protein NQ314_011798 [Rhamnusium bicolor]|uniref:Uncharacterized protein n=1 Tax=Rhamnusium bicolor TaxID=1586634 RepID=A0AAV8XF17_9CUCU|nr:hypothetical protein NQ314_011798 [Rhamnusium bicolor]